MTLYFITGNKNKFAEVKAVIPEVEMLDIDLPEIQEIDAKEIIKAKLQEALAHKEGSFIVEDTSLYLDGMNGLPGPLIKWFMQTMGNEGLAEIAQRNPKAQAKTIIGYARSPTDIHFFEGVVPGEIVTPAGKGFGWDPIFKPEGHEKTFGQMTADEKNSLSMRRMALNKLKEILT